ncbi:hypothetical protein D3C73_1226990 [compost metagenome]
MKLTYQFNKYENKQQEKCPYVVWPAVFDYHPNMFWLQKFISDLQVGAEWAELTALFLGLVPVAALNYAGS